MRNDEMSSELAEARRDAILRRRHWIGAALLLTAGLSALLAATGNGWPSERILSAAAFVALVFGLAFLLVPHDQSDDPFDDSLLAWRTPAAEPVESDESAYAESDARS